VTRSWRPWAVLLSISSGLLLAAAGDPLGLAPVAWVALAPLYVAIMKERRRRWSALYGFVAGVAYFSIHLSWIFLFGWMAFVALVAVMSSWWALAGVLTGVVRRLPLAPVLAAGIFSTAELLRDRVPWGGFGWGTPGLSQVAVPVVRGLAPAVGATGLTFLVAFAGAVLADRLLTRHLPWASLMLVSAVLVLFIGVDALRYGSPDAGEPVRVAVVQGNVPRPVLPSWSEQREAVVRGHEELTRTLVGRADVDLVVWGEDAIGEVVTDGLDRASALARTLGTPMVVGRSEVVPERNGFYNVMDHIDASGRVVDTYAKRHPVPFGEFVPLGFLRRFVTTLDQVPYDMLRGEEWVVFDVRTRSGRVGVATPICFESVFARDVRALARRGAEVMVYSTNDSSFERTFASEQHLTHVRMRAAELRQWGVQAAISGHSALVDPNGVVIERSPLFVPTVVEGVVQARAASSLYARVGDLFAWGWTAGSGLALALYALVLARGRRPVEQVEDRTQPMAPVEG